MSNISNNTWCSFRLCFGYKQPGYRTVKRIEITEDNIIIRKMNCRMENYT